MPEPHLLPAADIPPADLHAAFTRAFADYLIGPFTLPLDQWQRFLARQGVDLASSRVALGATGIQAFALTAPRADQASWRLGTMGAVPAGRGTGAAPALLDDFIARAEAHGLQQVELECFAQNERALRLYRGRGFVETGTLYGYAAPAGTMAAGPSDPGVEPVALAEAWDWIDTVSRRRRDLPLQVTPPALRPQTVTLHAWRCLQAQVVAGQSAPSQLTIYSLIDESTEQRGAERLVAHLMRRMPAHAVQVPQLQRDDVGGRALQRLGLHRLPLHQLLLRKELA